ncbi:ThiF family adenylyltransferase [Cribrihabitans sp. XS_ASV171]
MKKFVLPSVRLSVVQAANTYCVIATRNEEQFYFYGQGHFASSETQDALKNGFDSPTDEFLGFLCDHDLVFSPTDGTIERLCGNHSRQLSYLQARYGVKTAELILTSLDNACCAIVGVGGIGSHIAEHLCRIGVKRLVLVDHDTVERSNLNRQILYTENDIGKRKVDAAKYRLISIHRKSELHAFETIDEYINSTAFDRTTMVFVSADEQQFLLRQKLARACYPLGKSYMFIGYSGSTLRIGPMSLGGVGSCGACASLLSDLSDVTKDLSHRFQAAASGYANNAVGGAMAVERWLGALGGATEEAGTLLIALSDFTRRTIRGDAISGCPVCEQKR